jgi:hypothetical protein
MVKNSHPLDAASHKIGLLGTLETGLAGIG